MSNTVRIAVCIVLTRVGMRTVARGSAPADCGGDEPVQLVAMPELGVSEGVGLYGPTIIGDRIVANRLELVGEDIESSAFAVDEGGEHYVQLASMGGLVGGAGDWAFARREDEDGLRRVALDGSGPSELVFHTPIACVILMDVGLVAADVDGTLCTSKVRGIRGASRRARAWRRPAEDESGPWA